MKNKCPKCNGELKIEHGELSKGYCWLRCKRCGEIYASGYFKAKQGLKKLNKLK